MSASMHLAKAKDYIAKGDEYYAKAAEEIMAARQERPELTWVQIGRELGRSDDWARRLVLAREDFLKKGAEEPLKVDWESGSNKRADVTKATLAKAEPETIREIIADLPKEQKVAIEAVVEEELHPQRVEWRERVERSEEARREERKERHGFRYIQYEGILTKVRGLLREIGKEAEGVEFPTEEQELLLESLERAQHELELVRLALSGATGIDWDAEFAKIGGQV